MRLEFPAVNVSDVTLVKEGSEASVSVTVDASSAVVSLHSEVVIPGRERQISALPNLIFGITDLHGPPGVIRRGVVTREIAV